MSKAFKEDFESSFTTLSCVLYYQQQVQMENLHSKEKNVFSLKLDMMAIEITDSILEQSSLEQLCFEIFSQMYFSSQVKNLFLNWKLYLAIVNLLTLYHQMSYYFYRVAHLIPDYDFYRNRHLDFVRIEFLNLTQIFKEPLLLNFASLVV